jgi:hypothetical protein
MKAEAQDDTNIDLNFVWLFGEKINDVIIASPPPGCPGHQLCKQSPLSRFLYLAQSLTETRLEGHSPLHRLKCFPG